MVIITIAVVMPPLELLFKCHASVCNHGDPSVKQPVSVCHQAGNGLPIVSVYSLLWALW